MNVETKNKKLFTRRAVVLGSLKLGLSATLIGRMFYLQILSNDQFTKLSDKNRIRNQVIAPRRGKIVDRSNKLLATNVKCFQLIYTKEEILKKENLQILFAKLSKLIDLSPKEQNDIIQSTLALKIDDYIVIKENLTWEELTSLELNLFDLNGMDIELGFDRQYPYGALCAHLTGYIGSISTSEKLKIETPIYPNYKIGKNGIEKSREAALHGKAGYNKIEVNARGENIRIISTEPEVPGENIELAIDIEIQKKMFELLDDTGVAMLAKIETGEILASVSKPGYDPNLFNYGISLTEWKKLIDDPELPLIDRSVALSYPPGSEFKINVAIAALNNNFNPDTKFNCPGYFMVGNRAFKCWHKTGHGTINLYQAIAGSCNVYFWNVAKIIGIKPIAEMAKILGYGQKLLDSSLPREQAGIIPDPEWKLKNCGSKWTFADTINTTIGQGYVEATPIQILTMTARIASGLAITPTIFKSEKQKTDFPSLNLDKELDIVRKAMEMTTNNAMGTAYSNRITVPEYAMAGKTGTCQVISKRHQNDDLSLHSVDKKFRNHGVFIAYAPLKSPKYAFSCIIEHGGTPAKAIKIAKEILTIAQVNQV